MCKLPSRYKSHHFETVTEININVVKNHLSDKIAAYADMFPH